MGATAESAADQSAGPTAVAGRLGLRPGQVVQEFGYDDDVDDDAARGRRGADRQRARRRGRRRTSSTRRIYWWREGDGDLVDALVDALTEPRRRRRHLAAHAEVGPARARRAVRDRGRRADRGPARHQHDQRVPRLDGHPAGDPPRRPALGPGSAASPRETGPHDARRSARPRPDSPCGTSTARRCGWPTSRASGTWRSSSTRSPSPASAPASCASCGTTSALFEDADVQLRRRLVRPDARRSARGPRRRSTSSRCCPTSGRTARSPGRTGSSTTRIGFAIRGTFLVDTAGVLRWSIVNGPGEARPLSAYREAVAAL